MIPSNKTDENERNENSGIVWARDSCNDTEEAVKTWWPKFNSELFDVS